METSGGLYFCLILYFSLVFTERQTDTHKQTVPHSKYSSMISFYIISHQVPYYTFLTPNYLVKLSENELC